MIGVGTGDASFDANGRPLYKNRRQVMCLDISRKNLNGSSVFFVKYIFFSQFSFPSDLLIITLLDIVTK